MATTLPTSNLDVKKALDSFFIEYMGQNKFSPYMKKGSNAVIHVDDMLSRKRGSTMQFHLANSLDGGAVLNNARLDGAETELKLRTFEVTMNYRRKGVELDAWEKQKSEIDLFKAARESLMSWELDDLRSDIIDALGSINGTVYGSASEAAKNAWLTDNSDRVLFGDIANTNYADHSDSLDAIAASDVITRDMLSRLKVKAETASPKIRPIRIDKGDEYYVVFTDSHVFRELQADSYVAAANRDARASGLSNPIFTGGSLIVDGMIIVKVPEITSGDNSQIVNGSSVNISPVYLCGAQAICMAVGARPELITMDKDYKALQGVGVKEMRGLAKTLFGSNASADRSDLKDHGVATLYIAANN